MKKLIVALMFLSPLAARADIIKCVYTEPGQVTTYSMTESTLKIEHQNEPTRILTRISFQIIGRGRFELWDSNRRVVQRMTLNLAGKDGMSDLTYPYEGRRDGQIGGCSSNHLHAVGPE